MPDPGEVLVGYAGAPAGLVEQQGRKLDIPGLLSSIWDVQSAELAAVLVLLSFDLLMDQKNNHAKEMGKPLALAAVCRRGPLAFAIPVNDPVRLAEAEQLALQDRREMKNLRNEPGFQLESFWAFDPETIDQHEPVAEIDKEIMSICSAGGFETTRPNAFTVQSLPTQFSKTPQRGSIWEEDASPGQPVLGFVLTMDECVTFQRIVSFLKIFLEVSPQLA